MTGSVALDVVIGLVFIYLLYSLLATIVQEIVSTWLNLRAKNLRQAIKRMLDDDMKSDSFSKAFYDSPLIKYFARKKEKPSYFTAANFSKVILDILRGDDPRPGEDLRAKIDASLSTVLTLKNDSERTIEIKSGDTYAFLKSLWADAQGDIEKFRLQLEQWFNDTMDRASGWYKRKIQRMLFFIGLGIAIFFNVDSIIIADKLATDPALRQELIQQAERYLKEHPNLYAEIKAENEKFKAMSSDSTPDSTRLISLEKIKARSDSLMQEADMLLTKDLASMNDLLGIGIYNYEWQGFGKFVKSLFGWLLTALAISLGAPFWFDLLNKLMQLRNSIAVSSAGKAKEESSKPDKANVNVKTVKG